MQGNQILLDSPITTTAGAYSSGDSIGGLIVQYPGVRPGNGRVTDLKLIDTQNQSAPFYCLFFSEEPTASTITDNAAFVLAAADVPKVCGVIGVLATDYATINSKGFVDVACQVNIRWVVPKTLANVIPKLWMAVVSAGTPTYGANSTTFNLRVGLDTTQR